MAESKVGEGGTLDEGPLAGIKVLDLSRVLAGPFCSMILADLGAEVIKVEEIGRGDGTRAVPPFVNGESHYFLAINRNKQSIAVDLKKPEGRDLILKLAAKADVVVENFRPGVMDRLGLGYEVLEATNPNLVICSISGFGQNTSLRERASFDFVAQAMSGVMSVNGDPAGPPVRMGIPMGDIGSGMWAAIAILAGLQKRNATGRGSRIDLSMLECMMGLLGYLGQYYFVTGSNPKRVGNGHLSVVPYDLYPTKDGDIIIALHIGNFWRKFCVAVSRENWIADARFRTTADRHKNREVLTEELIAVLRTRTSKEWCEVFEAYDIPHALVLGVGEAVEQEVVKERGLVRTVDHPRAGSTKVIGSPLAFKDFDASRYKAPPLLGEHTHAVLSELGLSGADIEKLVNDKVVAVAENVAGRAA